MDKLNFYIENFFTRKKKQNWIFEQVISQGLHDFGTAGECVYVGSHWLHRCCVKYFSRVLPSLLSEIEFSNTVFQISMKSVFFFTCRWRNVMFCLCYNSVYWLWELRKDLLITSDFAFFKFAFFPQLNSEKSLLSLAGMLFDLLIISFSPSVSMFSLWNFSNNTSQRFLHN